MNTKHKLIYLITAANLIFTDQALAEINDECEANKIPVIQNICASDFMKNEAIVLSKLFYYAFSKASNLPEFQVVVQEKMNWRMLSYISLMSADNPMRYVNSWRENMKLEVASLKKLYPEANPEDLDEGQIRFEAYTNTKAILKQQESKVKLCLIDSIANLEDEISPANDIAKAAAVTCRIEGNTSAHLIYQSSDIDDILVPMKPITANDINTLTVQTLDSDSITAMVLQIRSEKRNNKLTSSKKKLRKN